jgi:hypothetical protein
MSIFNFIKGLMHQEKPKAARKKVCKGQTSRDAADEALRAFFTKRK